MSDLICQFCNKNFSSVSSLNNHQKKTKFCLIIQGKMTLKEEVNKKFECNNCKKILSSNQNLKNHIKGCQQIKVNKKDIVEFKCKFCKKILSTKKNLLIHLDTCIQKKDDEIKKLKEQLEKQKIELRNEYLEQIKDLQNKLDKIANKAIDRPTITNNTINNNKFELNTFPSQSEIDQKIESQFNDKYLFDGIKGVAQFVYDHIVKLEDGSIAYACFDTSRQVFKYKDQNGNEIKDPKAVKLRRMIKPGLLRQSQTLFDYFNEECDYLEKRKTSGLDVDGKEYNTMNTLRDKAFEVGCEILNIEDTNKFSNELSILSCL